MDYIVGYTGFVGSNINAKHNFDGKFHSTDIEKAFGGKPDLLVYSGVRAEMFLANKDPEADLQMMENAIDNIKKIAPKKIVLISTISVYPNPDGLDEDAVPEKEKLTAYGANRLYLEQWVENNIEDHLIVRLPGLFGKNLKKNFIYDYIHYIPALLNESKYSELSEKSTLIRENYVRQTNGFYKCMVNQEEKEKLQELKAEFKKLGFSALNFTDSRGTYQYYNLERLWDDISIALEHNIRKLNLAVEPVKTDELYYFLTGEKFVNELPKEIPYFNYKTKYADIWNGRDGYLMDKEQVLREIRRFVEDEQA